MKLMNLILKFLAKLKRSFSINVNFKSLFCRYKVTMPKTLFLKIEKPIGYDINCNNEIVQFKTSSKGIKQLKNDEFTEEVEIVDLLKSKYHFIIKNRILMLCCLIIITIIYLCSNIFIREIVFENNLYYDYDIYQSVKSHLNKVGIVYQLDDNINNINRELSMTYPHYAYIGIKKLGGKLVIEIVDNTIPNNENNALNDPGDMVSLYDGYIVDVITQNGVVTVGTSQYVKKGDLLISGNLNYHNNAEDVSNYVCPKGIVLGKTIIYEKIIVLKESKESIYNGDCTNYYQIDLLGNKYNINKYDYENIGYYNITNIFKLGSLFKVNKITEYHTEEITIIYSKEDAIKYAKSAIIHNFNTVKTHELECIESLDLLAVKDNGYAFEITFMTKYIRNFCKFQKKP